MKGQKDIKPRNVVGIKTIAKELSLSTCTVSTILSNKPTNKKYREETVKRVRNAAAKLGYQPNLVARSLVSGKTQTVGLCVADVGNAMFSSFARVFEQEAALYGKNTFICNTDEVPAVEERYLEMLISRRVDSLVVSSCMGSAIHPFIERARARGSRVVLFDRDIEGINAPSVVTDNYQATYALTKLCLSLGHRSIGIITVRRSDVQDKSLSERVKGIYDAARDGGLDDADVIMGSSSGNSDSSVKTGNIAMLDLLSRSRPPSLVLSLENVLSIGALSIANERGLHIGEDISFAGFDDFPGIELITPQVSIVAQPVAAMAKLCAQLACADEEPKIERVVIPSQLLWRESVGVHRA